MSVYAWCKKCYCRRDKGDSENLTGVECTDKSAHKKFVAWKADVQFSREHGRIRKLFSSKELADIQERQWKTDYERGLLLPSNKLVTKLFSEVAAEWSAMVVAQNRIKSFDRTEKYKVQILNDTFGKEVISRLTYEDGEDWINERLADGKSVGTVNRDMKTLKWIIKYALKKGYLKTNPFAELKELKGANIRVRWLTEAEINHLVQTIVDKIQDQSLLDVVEIGLNTGFRKGNLERLTARDISNNRITARKTKSGKPYDVPITSDIVPTLRRLIEQHPTGAILYTNGLDKRFRTAVKAAGLFSNPKTGVVVTAEDKVTIHTLRHTFAALYLKRGGDIYKLSKLLGHSSVAITERVYGHICPKELDAQAPLMSTAIVRPTPSAEQVIDSLKTSA